MEKGHQECVEFLKNPQKAFDTAKKQHRGAKVSDNWVNLCMAKPLPVKHADNQLYNDNIILPQNAELRLLITPNYGKENPTKTKKKRTLGGFLGGKKKAKVTIILWY